MANWLDLNSTEYFIFWNLSMITYTVEIQHENSLIFNPANFTNLSHFAKLNSVYVFIL